MVKTNVRTKAKKTERIEFRCSKAFKEMMLELSVQNKMSISNIIEHICTDKLFGDVKEISLKKQPKKKQENTKDFVMKTTLPRSKREDYEKEIWRMLQEGATPTETADWLNLNGFKPQRGEVFTMNSVHSIRRRLKKKLVQN